MAVKTFKGRAGVLWSKAPDEAFFELTSAYGDLIRTEVRARMKLWAKRVKAYMIENAPWEDQTGDARAGLGTEVGGNQHGSWLILFHSVPYGTYLEGFNPVTQSPMSNAGQWAIIEPTLDMLAPLLWNDIWKEFQRK